MATKRTSRIAKILSGSGLSAFKIGDWVEIRHSKGQRGRNVEFRGPRGPKGANVYRIRVRREPKSVFVELTEDLLKPVATAIDS